MSEVTTQRPTAAVDALVAVFRLLNADEQEAALKSCQQLWLDQVEGRDSETARMIKSLRRVAEVLGETPSVEAYKETRLKLKADGEELEPIGRIIRHFGSWHIAREAIDLSEVQTPRKIEARFRSRRLGKVWRYNEATLRETLTRAIEAIGHIPQVSEFDWWRQGEIDLAIAHGEELHLPSATPYRRRYGSWEAALLHFGYTSDEVAERLHRQASGDRV